MIKTQTHSSQNRSKNRAVHVSQFACIVAALVASVTASTTALAGTVRATVDGFVATSSSVEITVALGAVTRVVNKLTGEIHSTAPAANAPLAPWMPRGVLCPTAGADPYRSVRLLHSEWGKHDLYTGRLAESIANVARGPHAASVMTTTTTPRGIRCVWRGLTDGVRTFADDELTIEALIDDKTGHIELAADATTVNDDVVGVVVPIVNLQPRHQLYVPSFGGLSYPPADIANKLLTLNAAPYVEAPILVAEGSSGTVALWVEDPTFRPYVTLFGSDSTSTGLGIELLNDMPFEGKRAVRAAKWRINAFRGTWPTAMTPYRDWYARTFAPEIASREALGWPRDISVIVDRVSNDPRALNRLAKIIDPSRVLLHEWNPRQAAFDTMLPDWTPAPNFITRVQTAHALGLKVMGYVNTYCVNYNSPAFLRDGIASLGLTRQVKSLSDYGNPRVSFASNAPNEILYLDPLAPTWRRYHTDAMIRWRSVTAADANYEDTGGTAGDFGNGVIDGLRGAQGGTAQFRELLERNPVPMSSEFAPDNMAFAASWVLRYSQVWGTEELRLRWQTRHRPISSFIFGSPASGTGARAWVPMIAAESERQKWIVASCSDALGGVAQLEASDVSFDARAGMARHMVDRAQLFAELGLVPNFSSWPKDPTVVAQYRDRAGKIYHYRVRDQVQELVNSSGQPLYQRVNGKPKIDSILRIAGWPAWSRNTSIALNPDAIYALAPASRTAPLIQIDKCPSAAKITRYVESPDFVLVTFSPNGASPRDTKLGFIAGTDFVDVIVRDASGRVTRRNTPLATNARMDLTMTEPSELLLLRRAAPQLATPSRAMLKVPLSEKPVLGKFITDSAGIERGGIFTPPHTASLRLANSTTNTTFRFAAGGGDSEIAFDHLIVAPTEDSSVEFTVHNRQRQYGNGSICRAYVNGKLAYSLDLGPRQDAQGVTTWDTSAHVCRVPVGSSAGRPIVFTIAIWGKGDDNSDEIWMTEPLLVNDRSRAISSNSVAVVN